jgi:hypothetical protein
MNNFHEYKWILSEHWPENEVDDLIHAAKNLRNILVFLMQDCSQNAGWVGDMTKVRLHENAKKTAGQYE